MTKKAEREAEVLENKRVAYRAKVRRMLGHLFGRIDLKSIDSAFASGQSADDCATEYASREPVGRAIHPLKTQAVDRARKLATDKVEQVRADLEAHEWDREAAAPYPAWNMRCSENERDMLRAKNTLYSLLTRSRNATHRMGEPQFCDMDDECIERFIAENEKDAALQYDMFICKMVSKIGDAVSAEIEGSHVWGHSLLYVVKPNGVREIWKTQQIVNVSKLGRFFNQWPSRRMGK